MDFALATVNLRQQPIIGELDAVDDPDNLSYRAWFSAVKYGLAPSVVRGCKGWCQPPPGSLALARPLPEALDGIA